MAEIRRRNVDEVKEAKIEVSFYHFCVSKRDVTEYLSEQGILLSGKSGTFPLEVKTNFVCDIETTKLQKNNLCACCILRHVYYNNYFCK